MAPKPPTLGPRRRRDRPGRLGGAPRGAVRRRAARCLARRHSTRDHPAGRFARPRAGVPSRRSAASRAATPDASPASGAPGSPTRAPSGAAAPGGVAGDPGASCSAGPAAAGEAGAGGRGRPAIRDGPRGGAGSQTERRVTGERRRCGSRRRGGVQRDRGDADHRSSAVSARGDIGPIGRRAPCSLTPGTDHPDRAAARRVSSPPGLSVGGAAGPGLGHDAAAGAHLDEWQHRRRSSAALRRPRGAGSGRRRGGA